jgi:uncharacterized DUF497 family protein
MTNTFIADFDGFQWDAGNRNKNYEKHGVTIEEIEEVFLNSPLFFFEDVKHSTFEKRTLSLGKTFEERSLSITFTTRDGRIRVISARDMSKKERKTYEENAKEDTTV